MPQVDFNTYTTTIFLISNCFILGYVLLNIYFLVPLVDTYKVDKRSKFLINLRVLKAKKYLNLFNLFLIPLNGLKTTK